MRLSIYLLKTKIASIFNLIAINLKHVSAKAKTRGIICAINIVIKLSISQNTLVLGYVVLKIDMKYHEITLKIRFRTINKIYLIFIFVINLFISFFNFFKLSFSIFITDLIEFLSVKNKPNKKRNTLVTVKEINIL